MRSRVDRLRRFATFVRGLMLAATALAVAIAAGCGDGGGTTREKVQTTEEAITGGTRVPTAALPQNGVVEIQLSSRNGNTVGTGYCSGTLLTNRWVLTAAHCFCASNVSNPSSVTVSVYGTLDTAANTALGALYTTTASQVILNSDYDAALIKLTQTLPVSYAPQIYTGNGSDLVGKTVNVYGFGESVASSTKSLDQSEYTGTMQVTSVSLDYQSEVFQCVNPNDPPVVSNINSGPHMGLAPGQTTVTQVGDSGGPAFLGTGANAVLIGDLYGGNGKSLSTYTGIWYYRDWIKQQTGIWTATQCGQSSLPGSTGTIWPAIATGPDGILHVVANFSDNSIGHWTSADGLTWTNQGKISGAFTTTAPALTTESGQASGQPLNLGMAFRNPSNQVFTYARWAASTGWSTPKAIKSGLTVEGGLSGNHSLIGFIGLNGVAAITQYLPANDDFLAAQWAPAGAPLVDPARAMSVIFDPASALGGVGYLTPSGQWVQMQGNWNCYSTTSSYLCNPDPPYNTDWNQALLSYNPGDRFYIDTVRTVGSAFPQIERRVVLGQPSWPWGWNVFLLGNIASTDYKGEIYVARTTYNGLIYVAPEGNCFGNTF